MTAPKLRTLLALIVVALWAISATAVGAILNVDSTVDDPGLAACDDATPNDCSLRGAIIKANGLTEAVTINVPAGTYIMSQATPCSFRGNDIGPLFNAFGLCPTGNLTIVGAGANATIIDANQPPGLNLTLATVLMVATTAKVTIQGITLRGGNYSASTSEGTGGGINNAGVLALVDSVVTENWTAGDGGGIFNQGDVTVLRSVVSRNVARHGGGGILNSNLFGTCVVVSPCHDGQGILTIADSTIADNQAVDNGGGIFNSVGVIDISGSTISGNQANGGGGAVYNGAWNVSLANVTVSGNRARVGGGLYNAGPSASTMSLNNVTIANNTAQDPNDPTFGLAGGLWNGTAAAITLGNTIIAGNFAAGNCTINGCIPPGNDCFTNSAQSAALVSLGYNLIQDIQNCAIAGDTTGNIAGKDPKLGLLADNGGRTLTHAPASDSPAVDKGNPASPGGGAPACPVTDQRAFVRPIGARCDIGAVERSTALSIANVFPAGGGNAGQVSIQIGGGGFLDGASVRLRRTGHPDIGASETQVDIGGSSIATTLDLTGVAAGAWDVIVTNPDSTSTTLPGGFTVKPGVGPDLWVDVVGILGRAGKPGVLMVIYGNRGDADAIGVPISIVVPQGFAAGSYFMMAAPPAQIGQVSQNWDLEPPMVADAQDRFLQLPLLLPVVPAGFSGNLRVTLTLPPGSPGSFMVAAVGEPLFMTGVTQAYIDNIVAGAQAYVQQTFGIAIPATLVPRLRQYATTQIQSVLADGRSVFSASFGTDPQVYSVAQLQLDLAAFGAALATGATH